MAIRLKVLVAALAATMLAVPAANAGLLDPILQLALPTCGATVYPFKQFGDTNAYYAIPNNGFESGATGWSLAGGAKVAYGNEPFYINGIGGHSLSLPAGASATSPSFCINLLDPVLRMVARGSNGGKLNVQIVFHGLTGNLTGVLNYKTIGGTGSWQPTDPVSSQLALPLLTSSAQVRVTSSSGTWTIDDVFEDPSVFRVG